MAGTDRDVYRMVSQCKYKHVDKTKKDIMEAINSYRALEPHIETFVFNDGSTKELVNLCGTIPVMYKGNTYHFPICVWIVDTHPNNAPMCFVKPTPDMCIKVSRFCDHNGKIYLPYLHDWQPAESDLLGLIQVMIMTFGDFPPVYSKPKQQQQQQNATPYPPAQQQQPFMPQPGASGYPPYPPTSGGGGGGGGGGYPPYPSSYAAPYPPMPGYPPNVGYNPGYPPATPSSGGGGGGTGTITEEHIKASLISAVEDKVRRRLQERVNQCQAEIQTLNRTKQELTEGQTKIKEIIYKLELEEVEMKKTFATLKEKDQELDKCLETIEKAGEMNIDEAVFTTTPLYRQLLNAYTEEAAIEDAIYYLGEALRKNVIDLEVFLKYVRQLSRKQYMLRALMQKCRNKAGLAN